MDRQQITREEWENAENWSGPRWIALYFSRRDPRLWVPKRVPWMGWTLNFGHPTAVWWLIGVLLFVALAPVLTVGLFS